MKNKLRMVRRGDKYALQLKTWYWPFWQSFVMFGSGPTFFMLFSDCLYNLKTIERDFDRYIELVEEEKRSKSYKKVKAKEKFETEVVKEVTL